MVPHPSPSVNRRLHPFQANLSSYYRGEALEQAQAWTRLPEEERRRRAMDAAQRHDVVALWRLTENWLLTHGEQGAHVSPHTRAAYARGGRLLLETWRHENLLRPSRMAGADIWRTVASRQALSH